MYYAICYVSSANDLLNFEIKELLSSTTNKNLKNNISGILLHNAGNFLQYMEGTKKEVQALYHNHIAKDTRHKDPIVLIEKDIDHRYFDGYDSGFTSILDKDDSAKLRAYIELLKHTDIKEVIAVTSTIETFLGKSSN